MTFDMEQRWRLGAQVALRPEPFGALVYHFGTRRLSFLKSRKLLAVVQALAEHATAREAFAAAGVEPAETAGYARAMQTLVSTGMVERCA